MRYEASVTSISWIPSEAIEGLTKLPFEMGLTRYDDPPPEDVPNFAELLASDRFRFANHLKAWVEIENGRIVDHGYSGSGHMNVSTVRLGRKEIEFAAIPLPDIQQAPETRGAKMRFVQTAGGRTGMPAPRRVRRKPFVQLAAPLAWTTLALEIAPDGSWSYDVVGASPFPRHWIYDSDMKLQKKTGLIDFHSWYREAFGSETPWGNVDSPAFVTEVETALERELSRSIMRADRKPRMVDVAESQTLVEQGERGTDLFLLLDGILGVEVGGECIAEVGPGAILGERALLEEGIRTSTLRAVTRCRVAVAEAEAIDPKALEELSGGHHREDR